MKNGYSHALLFLTLLLLHGSARSGDYSDGYDFAGGNVVFSHKMGRCYLLFDVLAIAKGSNEFILEIPVPAPPGDVVARKVEFAPRFEKYGVIHQNKELWFVCVVAITQIACFGLLFYFFRVYRNIATFRYGYVYFLLVAIIVGIAIPYPIEGKLSPFDSGNTPIGYNTEKFKSAVVQATVERDTDHNDDNHAVVRIRVGGFTGDDRMAVRFSYSFPSERPVFDISSIPRLNNLLVFARGEVKPFNMIDDPEEPLVPTWYSAVNITKIPPELSSALSLTSLQFVKPRYTIMRIIPLFSPLALYLEPTSANSSWMTLDLRPNWRSQPISAPVAYATAVIWLIFCFISVWRLLHAEIPEDKWSALAWGMILTAFGLAASVRVQYPATNRPEELLEPGQCGFVPKLCLYGIVFWLIAIVVNCMAHGMYYPVLISD